MSRVSCKCGILVACSVLWRTLKDLVGSYNSVIFFFKETLLCMWVSEVGETENEGDYEKNILYIYIYIIICFLYVYNSPRHPTMFLFVLFFCA